MNRSRAMLLVTLTLIVATPAGAVPVPGLFDTGVDDQRVTLAAGAVDPHYTLVSSADPNYPGPAAIVAGQIPTAYWFANNAVSKWIAPAIDEGYPSGGTPHPAGTYRFRLSFDLTGLDPSTVAITGTAGADNSGAIQLNGVAVTGSIPSYNPLTPFSIHSGFVAGVNHLDFVVTNLSAGGANPTGIRVQGLSGTGDATVGVGAVRATALELRAPSPNPSRGDTRIGFALPSAARVRLRVTDLAGRTVRMLADRDFASGRQEAVWDGRTSAGAPVRAGLYFVTLEAEGRQLTRRVARAN